jgi:hypothetical protein
VVGGDASEASVVLAGWAVQGVPGAQGAPK